VPLPQASIPGQSVNVRLMLHSSKAEML